MGAQNSSFRRCISEEFQRLKKSGRDYLVIDELIQLKLPRSQWSINLENLSVMFVMDKNKDGRFSIEELQGFYELACDRAKTYQTYEFMSMMHGYCTLLMWQAVSAESGHKEFNAWVCTLMTESLEARTFPQHPGTTYVNRDSIETLHHIMGVKESQGLDFQSFFDLLQRAGEEKKLMDLDDEELDDYLPIGVVSEFTETMVQGMEKVIGDIYPAGEMQKMEF